MILGRWVPSHILDQKIDDGQNLVPNGLSRYEVATVYERFGSIVGSQIGRSITVVEQPSIEHVSDCVVRIREDTGDPTVFSE